jgi:hypothetical protein
LLLQSFVSLRVHRLRTISRRYCRYVEG